MMRATLFLALLFCCNGVFSNPLQEKTKLWVYQYDGEVEGRTSANNETLSRWTVSGKITAYNSLKHVILKLDNVTTSLFNGDRNNVKNVQEKEIPEESKALLLPFKVKIEEDDYYIYFEESDPLWSRNFKRGIASNMDFDVSKLTDNTNAIYKEKSVHGLCEVSYKVDENAETKTHVYQKIINHDSCTNLPEIHITNLKGKAPSVKDFESQHSKTIKTATFRPDDKGVLIPFELVSTSNLVIKTMPNSLTTQHLDQHQKLSLISNSDIEESDELDISKATDRHDLIYEATFDPTVGRHAYEKDNAVLIQAYRAYYNKFVGYFVDSPMQNLKMGNRDEIDNMFFVLLTLNAEGFEELEQSFSADTDDVYTYHQRLDVYYSLLSHVGTDECVKYLIKNIDVEHKWGSKEMYATKILALLPYYIQNPTEDLLKRLEVFLDFKNFISKSTKNAGVLSFASIVVQVYKKDPKASKETLNKYIELYHEKFLNSESYDDRMNYLLGLVNMAEVLEVDFINNIITNSSESVHIRTLALSGFKARLSEEDTKIKNLYKTYWPIVQNKQEPFEVRVAALDLLLSLKLSEEQFNTIVKKYSLHFNDPYERHLANYLLTTLHSLQNTTAFVDNLGALSFEALKNNHIPSFPSFFTTANYRISQTDEDVGSSYQVRLITAPTTKALKIAQFTFNSYGFSYNLGEYTVYLNVDGLMEGFYAEYFLKNLKNATSVPELVNMLKENSFEMKDIERDIHIDIVVFYNDVAVYAHHFGKWEKRQLERFAQDLQSLAEFQLNINYPLVDYKHLPTDLGTPLQISNMVQEILYQGIFEDTINMRHSWSFQSWIESYNPLVDSNIATYKYIGTDKLVNLNYTADERKQQISWLTKNDSYAVYWDNTVGTTVDDEEELKQYCKDCNSCTDLKYNLSSYGQYENEAVGLQVLTTEKYYQDNEYTETLSQFFEKDYQSNYDAHPIAGPVLFLQHFLLNDLFFHRELSSGSYEVQPFWDGDMESSVSIVYDGDLKKLNNPMTIKEYEVIMEISHKSLTDEKNSCYMELDLFYGIDPRHKNKTGEEKNIKLTQQFNVKYVPSDHSKSKRICALREAFLPYVKADKYSLEPVESTTAYNYVKWTSDMKDKDCTNGEEGTLKVEPHWSTDKAEKLKDRQNKKDYEECLENSKDLKFVEPSSACRRIASQLGEYNNYQAIVTMQKGPEGDEKIPTTVSEFIRENDYVKLGIMRVFAQKVLPEGDAYFNKTFYYPRIIANPNAVAYGDQDFTGFLPTSTCTITPSTVELFSGKYVPNQQEKWFAFGECHNTSIRGMSGRSVDKTHVEFDLYSRDNVLNVEYKNDKAHLKLNGKELVDTYACNKSELKVYFIAENVFYIFDNNYSIYYNTEYVQINFNALHSSLLCGLCTKDQM